MNFLKNSYLDEIIFRLIYICIAFLSCLIICYIKSDVYLTFMTYPYLKLNTFKRLIAINVNELFSLSIYVSTVTSLIFVFPFLIYQTKSLLFCAWFENQAKDYETISKLFWVLFIVFFMSCYKLIVPLISKFLIDLDLETHSGLLVLELEPRMTNYLDWVFPLLFSVANILPCVIFVTFWLLQSRGKKQFLYTLVHYRKFLIMLLLTILIITVPVDFVWQLILSSILIGSFEFFVFCCCWYK